MAIETYDVTLPHGITLACRACGPVGAPGMVFLHGFPEAAFIWDELLAQFGARYRCVAPNLRGYAGSSAPTDVRDYRPRHLVADIAALIDGIGGPLEALVAHDWGGALAWNLAAQRPALLKRLLIINAPHPATFLRELQSNPAQQAASRYMNFLRRPDAGKMLAEDDHARLFRMLGGANTAWLDDVAKRRYRDVWNRGLEGALNYYRASPLRPPTSDDDGVLRLRLDFDAVTVRVPTRVVWAEDDVALLPALLDGLDAYVPALTVQRVSGASHWIVHERPDIVAAAIEATLR